MRDRPVYRLRRLLLRLFASYTRARYTRLARRVAMDIEDYRRAGMRVLGIVGVGASPSCGVRTTSDLDRSFEVLAACPLACVDRSTVNERAVAACRTAGEGCSC